MLNALREKLNRVSEDLLYDSNCLGCWLQIRGKSLMTNRLNSVVIKLWLTILFIVTTVLILLSLGINYFLYNTTTHNKLKML